MPKPSEALTQLLSQGDMLKEMQKNALSKQYNLTLSLKVEEANGGKKYFDCPLEYSGVPYPFVVLIEAKMVELLQELVQLGKTIATGEPPAI